MVEVSRTIMKFVRDPGLGVLLKNSTSTFSEYIHEQQTQTNHLQKHTQTRTTHTRNTHTDNKTHTPDTHTHNKPLKINLAMMLI
jgi:hypothetical protein